MELKENLDQVSWIVYVLVMLFGISSWIDINGLFVELPLMVNVLPEGWNLPSYISLIIQFANIGPLAYTIGHKLAPNKIKEWPTVYVIVTIGAISCLLLIFLWDVTSYIGGEEHSTGLLTLTGFLALVDCTSSVVYLPYMAFFKPQYLTAFYIGESLSALLPGLLGLAQGVGGDAICVNTSVNDNGTEFELIAEYPPARFGVEVFFFCLFLLICVSGTAFTFLHFSSFCQKEKLDNCYTVKTLSETSNTDRSDVSKSVIPACDDVEAIQVTQFAVKIRNYESTSSSDRSLKLSPDKDVTNGKKIFYVESASSASFSTVSCGTSDYVQSDVEIIGDRGIESKKLSLIEFVILMVFLAFVNSMTNGVMPSTLSYSCLPYGNQAYGLATRLGTLASPLACFFAFFVSRVSMATTSILVGVGAVASAYLLYLAALSPTPPLQDETAGVILVVFSYVLLIALFSYVKVVIATCCRDDGGRTALLWCGGMTQIGSFVGAVVIFICINTLSLFTSAPTCPTD